MAPEPTGADSVAGLGTAPEPPNPRTLMGIAYGFIPALITVSQPPESGIYGRRQLVTR